jgi:hypothetical protein
MQILHPFTGSIQQYLAESSDTDRYRPPHCRQCGGQQPLVGHGCYHRTLVDSGFDGRIRVPRYWCRLCRRTVSLLPYFALPWLRSSLAVISLFLVARLLRGLTLVAAAAAQPTMPYQRGQFWVRRFRHQAQSLTLTLVAKTSPSAAPDFVRRALDMVEAIGWSDAHRFLFGDLRAHLLGWPASLAPCRRRATLAPATPSA